MIENHAPGILLGQKPCHPDVASSCSNEEDTPSQHGQTANEDGCNGWDDTQNNAGHHGSHHIAGNMHRLVTMAVGSQQFPHNTEADALPTAFCITCPRQAVNQFMNHDTHDDKDKGDAPIFAFTISMATFLRPLCGTSVSFVAERRSFTSCSSILSCKSEKLFISNLLRRYEKSSISLRYRGIIWE